ncbi:hypothetical protein DPMN_111970 [Dreissena polymorpha]|uniref:Uncharacterized protein n=1 Tax=Dreissena polymorpha TaxID=45954 RepID=A0A9D4QQ89_DREPO|nr:hypothetical protein DPMN_111970 [Dreissena polymorpha]
MVGRICEDCDNWSSVNLCLSVKASETYGTWRRSCDVVIFNHIVAGSSVTRCRE